MRHARWWWVAFVLWALALVYLSSRTPAHLPLPAFRFSDKIAHLAYFTAGGLLLGRALRLSAGHSWSRVLLLVTVTVILAVVGGADEWFQTFTPGRHGGDPGDWIADTAGGLLGGLLALRISCGLAPAARNGKG